MFVKFRREACKLVASNVCSTSSIGVTRQESDGDLSGLIFEMTGICFKVPGRFCQVSPSGM